MLCTGRFLLGCALLATPAAAQQLAPSARLYPVTAPVRDAGTVDVTTGRWTRGGALKAGSQLVYNNTCVSIVGGSYAGFDWCEDVYDEGRVPSPSDPNAPFGAEASNSILSMQVTYCTFVGPTAGIGGYDMDVAFWDKLGGDCVGAVPPTPPPVSSTATAYFPLAGLGLPGSTAFGFQACWIVTLDLSNSGFVLASDGEGSFDGTSVDDSFIWMQRQNATQVSPILGSPDGFLIAGEPAVGGYGSCTYNIPCGTGMAGLSCGTGLDTFDGVWINVDGIGVGSSGGPPAGCPNSVSQYGFGTNCYFFGGYPTNPLASLWMVLESDGGRVVDLYCGQAKTTSVSGCTASLSASDLSLATGTWDTTDIPRHTSLGTGTTIGIYIFTHGVGIGQSAFSANTPFGTLCLNGFKRSAPLCTPVSAATVGGVCNASVMSLAVNCNGGALGIAVGQDVNVQLWYRDPTPANPGSANFSNAIFYTLQ